MIAAILIPLGLLTNILSSGQRTATDEDKAKQFSCRHQCGGSKTLPCSCLASCLVYHNCCQDFEAECPALVEAGRRSFGKILNSEAICSQDGYFMIASCPSEAQDIVKEVSIIQPVATTVDNQTHESLRDNVHPTTTAGFRAQNLEASSSRMNFKNSLLTQFEDIPVTDMETGLVFTNFTTFSCHSGENAQPIFWKTTIPLLRFDQPESVKQLTSIVDATNTQHTPPSEMTSALVPCIPVSIGTCKDNFAQNSPEVEYRCGAYITYVYLTVKHTIYDNLDCLQCNGINPNVSEWIPCTKQYGSRVIHKFSIMFDFHGDVVTGTAFNALNNGDYISWQTVTCTLPGRDALETVDVSCHIDTCAANGVIRENGKCAVLHQMLLAVASDGQPLTAIEKRQLPQFIQCFMRDHLSYDVLEETTPIRAVSQYDTTTGQTMYITRLLVYIPTIIRVSCTRRIDSRLVEGLEIMSKIFKSYRKSNNNDNSLEIRDDFEDRYAMFWAQKIGSSFIGTNVTTNETTVSCAGVSSVQSFINGTTPVFKDNAVCCRLSPVYVRDEAILKIIKESPCAAVFESVACSSLSRTMTLLVGIIASGLLLTR